MADTKITALTALTAADPANDVIPIVDVSDTTMAASGTTKKISVNNILSSSPTASGALTVTGLVTAGSATITGDLTVATDRLKVVTGSTAVQIGATTQTQFGTTAWPTSYVGKTGSRVLIGNSGELLLWNEAAAVSGNLSTMFVGAKSGPSATIIAGGAIKAGIENITDFSGFLTLSTQAADATMVENLRITSTGNVNISTGNVVMATSGKGIDFSATANSSGTMTSELLNDYEEGTFTPTISSGATAVTFSTQDGKYTKVGRLVTIFIRITTTVATRNGSQFIISGLPFSVVTDGAGVIAYNNSGFISTAGGNKPNLLLGGSAIEFYTSSGGSFAGTAIAADVFDLRLTATYYV
jgi:hypothetical protein